MREILPLTDRPVLALSNLTDPAGTWERLTQWLHAGATTPTHAFRWPVVSTVTAAGDAESRVVVLRRFNADARLLVFHTDVRSPKIADLKRSRRCEFLFYDPDDRIQLRASTTADIHHHEEFACREFDALTSYSRASYAAATAPGTDLPADAPFDYPPGPPVNDEVAFDHFAAVACTIERIDALELHTSGHRRAVLDWTTGTLRMRRVAP